MFTFETIQIPLISPIISLIIFAGLYQFGHIIINYLQIGKNISKVSELKFQNALIGIIFSTFIIFPFVQLNFFNKYFIYFFSFFLIFLGIFNIIKNLNKLKLIKFNYTLEKQLILFILICYFLISLGLITDADSLDYHLGVPLYILNNETYPNEKFWIHLTKSGSGEILYTIGFINNALQLPGLTQFAGLLSIAGLFLKKQSSVKNIESNYLLLIAISCPVLIFFLSSAKVQLVYVASSSLLFTLIFFSKNDFRENLRIIIFFSVLCVTAISAKFSFALSSFILWFSFLVLNYSKKFLFNYIVISIIVFSYILIPKSIYKIELYDFSLLESFVKPLPTHLYGYKQLYLSLTSCGYKGCFPFWLVFPKDIGSFSETLGIGGITIFLIKFRKEKQFYLIFSAICIQILMSFFYGPNNARWFLEPFIWTLITSKYIGFSNNFLKNIFLKLGLAQSFIIIIPLLFAIYSLTPGSFLKSQQIKVLKKNADGYELLNWMNKNINNDDITLSTHRSFSLGNKNTIPGDFLMYIDLNNEQSYQYFEEIKKLKPNLILFYDQKKYFNNLKNCLGKLLYYKENVGSKASRNPFNRGNGRYNGYIYELKYEKLPWCLYK